MEQDLNVIQNFNVLPTQSLELLGQRLGLKMSRAELLYCARHYKSRGSGEISTIALRFIDALACPERTTLDKIALSELLTDHTYIAKTFADAVSKLNALGKDPDKPFTLRDVANLSVRYTTAVKQKDITEPIGFGGTPVQYAAKGMSTQISLESTCGHFDVLQPLPITIQAHAEYADTLVLLRPTHDAQPNAFDSAVTALLCSELGKKIHCVCDMTSESVAHAVLRVTSGAVLNLSGLPEQLDHPLTLTAPCTGLLLALPQDAALSLLLQQTQSPELCAYEIGLVDHAGYLIVKRGKEALLSLDASYLKSICFIRSYTLHMEEKTVDAPPMMLPLKAPADAIDESYDERDAVLRTLPPLRTRNAAYAKDTSYRAAALCALKAYCTAVAAGSDPKRIWLNSHICQDSRVSVSTAASDLLCTLLGLYRFSMELGVPVHTDAELAPDQKGVTVLASAPADMVISERLQGHGKLYLLASQTDANGMPVWSELRALIAYLRRALLEGKIKSARYLCGNTPADELTKAADGSCGVILNPHGMQVLDTPHVCAFLVETDAPLEGELIAVSKQRDLCENAEVSDHNS